MDFPFPAKKSAWLSPLIPILLALILTAPLFSGCAHHGRGGKPVASIAADTQVHKDVPETAKKAAPLAAANIQNDLQPTEGDIAIESEIKALERTGKWGKADKEPPTRVGGLDTSKYDFPVVLNNQVAAYLDIFQDEQHEMFQRWLARSTKYLPMIQRELAKAGLPQDLAYLSMIESGYTPTAQSSAGAVGLWQFMRDTGKHYTLRIDDYIDERRHIEKSTKAAVNMLAELYRDFGDWHLAVAAYNSGPARVQNGLSRFDAKTFWELADEEYLPLETKRYVPKLIAAIIIAKDPQKYGFNSVSYQPEFNYDRLAVTPGLTLDAVALVAGCNTAAIKSLNPELHRGIVPPNTGRYVVRIPVGSKDMASRNLALLRTVRDTKYRQYVVKRRENMATVCSRNGISRTTLLKANKLRSERLTPGQRLLIPYTVTSYALGGRKSSGFDESETMTAAAATETDTSARSLSAKTLAKVSAKASTQSETALHTVREGDTLAAIARKYQMSQKDLLALNGKTQAKQLQIGQQLKVINRAEQSTGQLAEQSTEVARVSKGKGGEMMRKVAEQESSRSGIAASPRNETALALSLPTKKAKSKEITDEPSLVKIDKTIVKHGRNSAPDWYMVKNGETIWGIAKKHNISPDQIKKWNKLKSNSIHAGLRLKVREA